FELGAEEWQLDFPTVYGSAKHNWMSDDWKNQTDNIEPLLDMVLEHIPSPKVEEGTVQMLITSLDFSSFTGRIAIGRLQRGVLRKGIEIALVRREGSKEISTIMVFLSIEGVGSIREAEGLADDRCALVGLRCFQIGDTVADTENPVALKSRAIS